MKPILFSLLFCLCFYAGSSYYYSCPYATSCSSGCCNYYSSLYIADITCSTSYCSCSSYASYCSSTTTTTAGYHNCTGCSTTCCYYSTSLSYNDSACNSYYCSCASTSYCAYNSSSSSSSTSTSTSTTSSGYHYCSSSTCSSGCCYYSASLTYSDYYCTSLYCSCASYYSSCSYYSSSYNYLDYWATADRLSAASGETYVVVNYPAWKAAVGVGAAICGITFFLDLYLFYFKCFHKPRGFVSP